MRFNPNIARELIMSHYTKPNNKTELQGEFQTCFSTTCSDKLNIQTEWEDDKLVDVRFNGHGCAVFMASTDIFLDKIKGLSLNEIKELTLLFEKFVNQEQLSDEQINSLGDLWVFFNTKTHLNRVVCALLTPKYFLENE
ncbi:iron-sulfur cluster assembly scaffold protein [Mycoplasma sp. CSL7503-lung]|uniref:iron-sulfur cluster assembly scaffold protein n=1 Tax=Mycoplasma sp. CSL7503-lung TaxID=536372 RepID=UPI0021CE9C59|nr:iron-sulfur cluster assembly scaffold protein [Mycoplasma sp. CSL7503-lung]MCU4706331.1 iron-sulfur cluster assembly scaffold protein [Mycoplasma sp. CSL7503-lung]